MLPPLAAFILLQVFRSLFGASVWFLFYPAVFLSSWIGGLRVGVVATVASSLAVLWHFLPPENSLTNSPGEYLAAAVFLATGVLFGAFHERLRSANRNTANALAASERMNVSMKRIANERRAFGALIENSSDFVGIADANGKPVYLNPAGRRMVGLLPDQPVETTQITDYYTADQRDFASDVILKSMIEQGHWEGETSFRHWQTQAAIAVSDTHFMIRDPETGELLGMGTITRDISEIKRARDEAERARRELDHTSHALASLVEYAPDGIFVADLEGRYTEVNGAACHMLGYEREELIGKSIVDQIPADRVEQLEREKTHMLAGDFQVSEWVLRRKDGSYLPVEVSATILSDDAGRRSSATSACASSKSRRCTKPESASISRYAGANLAAWDRNIESGEVISLAALGGNARLSTRRGEQSCERITSRRSPRRLGSRSKGARRLLPGTHSGIRNRAPRLDEVGRLDLDPLLR